MEMQVPPEKASMPDPGHVFDPHLTLASLDLYPESTGHLQPVSFISLSLCSCALAAKTCCFFPALDAPSSSVCSAVPSQDRLLCASLPISQGDCEARGCCYDPRDRVKPCYFGNTGKPEQQFSLPSEMLQSRISHFAGKACLVFTTPAGASGLWFWLPRISCPSEVSSNFHCIATDLVLCPASVLFLELAVLVLPSLALVLWVKGRTACRTCWSCLCCDVRAFFPSLLSLSSRLIVSFSPVTAQCTPDGHFSIAVSRYVTLPPVALDSVQLASGHSTGCVPVLTNSAFVVYQFPLSACGTTFQVRVALVARLEELEQPDIALAA